jgi:hypothetical protein
VALPRWSSWSSARKPSLRRSLPALLKPQLWIRCITVAIDTTGAITGTTTGITRATIICIPTLDITITGTLPSMATTGSMDSTVSMEVTGATEVITDDFLTGRC